MTIFGFDPDEPEESDEEYRERHERTVRRNRWIEVIRSKVVQSAVATRELHAVYIMKMDQMRGRASDIMVSRWNWLDAMLSRFEDEDLEEWADGQYLPMNILILAEGKYGANFQHLDEARAQKGGEDHAGHVAT